MVTVGTGKTRHFLTLDAMRGVAAIAVMIHHYTQFDKHPLLGNALLAVDLFFILSGFVITHAYAGRLAEGITAREYLARRLIRLYPMFIVGLMFGTGVFFCYAAAGHADFSPQDIARAAGVNALFLPYLNHKTILTMGSAVISGPIFPADGPLWSLFCEWRRASRSYGYSASR